VTKIAQDKETPREVLVRQLFEKNGPLMSGEALWRTIGFTNAAAFRQAKSQGRLGVPVFSVPRRRGTFAFTKDVANWLINLEREVKM